MLTKIYDFRANLNDAYSNRVNSDNQSFEVKELTLIERVKSLALEIVTLLGIIFSLGNESWKNASKELFARVLTGKVYMPFQPIPESTVPLDPVENPSLLIPPQPVGGDPQPAEAMADPRMDPQNHFEQHTTPSPLPTHEPVVSDPPVPAPSLPPTPCSSLDLDITKPIVISELTVRDFATFNMHHYDENELKSALETYYSSLNTEISTVGVEYKKRVGELSLIEFQQASGEYLNKHLGDIPPMLFAILTNSQIRALELRNCDYDQIGYLLYFDVHFDELLKNRIETIGIDKFKTLKTPRPAAESYSGYRKDEFDDDERIRCIRLIESLRWPVRVFADLVKLPESGIKSSDTPVPSLITQTPPPPKVNVGIEVGQTVDLTLDQVFALQITVRMDSIGRNLPSHSSRADLQGMVFLYHGSTLDGSIFRVSRTK